MIITKPKQKIYIGLAKGMPAIQEGIKKSLSFEFESFSRAEVFEANLKLFNASKAANSEELSDEAKMEAMAEFVEYAKSKIVAIHSDRGFTVDCFPGELFFSMIDLLLHASMLSEDDALFLD